MRRPAQEVTETELAMLQVFWDGARRPGARWPMRSTRRGRVALCDRAEAAGPAGAEGVRGPRASGGEAALVFRATVDRDAFIGRRLQALADKLCGGASAPLLMNLVRTQPLSADEVEALYEFLREKRRAELDGPGRPLNRPGKKGGTVVDALMRVALNNAAWSLVLAIGAAVLARAPPGPARLCPRGLAPGPAQAGDAGGSGAWPGRPRRPGPARSGRAPHPLSPRRGGDEVVTLV